MMIGRLIHYGFSFYELGLLIYVVCGWVTLPCAFQVREWLGRWYEPVLNRIRSYVPFPHMGGIAVDVSPLILFLALGLFKRVLLSLFVPTH